jgi:hypothetical protein
VQTNSRLIKHLTIQLITHPTIQPNQLSQLD